jgi:mRNA interferase MazF
MVNFNPVEGHEQDGTRPALVLSRDELNRTGLCMVVPGTRTVRNRPGRVRLPRVVGGVVDDTYLLSDRLRTVSTRRFVRRLGSAEVGYIRQVLLHVGHFLSLP